MNGPGAAGPDPGSSPAEAQLSLLDLWRPIAQAWRLVVFGPLVVGALAYGISFLIPPTFTARVSLLPPQQQQQVGASAALASLGALGGLAGAAGLRMPADQYVSLLQSVSVMDALIDRFQLLQVYDEEFRVDARRELEQRVRVQVGKRDGLIAVEVDDRDPARAAAMANAHVEELRRLTAMLALTEAQQRRRFFEGQLEQTRQALTAAQIALQSAGFNPGALRVEPRAAAESYARLRAELTAAEVRLQGTRRLLADTAPEVLQQQAVIDSLRAELRKLETAAPRDPDPGYIGRFREFKYQETLFELYARQFELARMDESREGVLIQVVDTATPPEKRSKPKRRFVVAGAVAASLLLILVVVVLRGLARRGPSGAQP